MQEEGSREVKLTATTEWLPVGSEGSSSSSCTETRIEIKIHDDFVQPMTSNYVPDGSIAHNLIWEHRLKASLGTDAAIRLFSPTGRWYAAWCDGDLSFLPEGGPAVSVNGLVERAVALLDAPEPALALTPAHGKHVVGMSSWLAVDPAYWAQERTRTVTSNRVEVTAWLEPYEVSWETGDGEVKTCTNPGQVWRVGLPESANSCEYVYEQASWNPPDHTYDLSGTVRFRVGHTTNAPGTYGPFVPVERTTTETIQVVEIQAIGT